VFRGNRAIINIEVLMVIGIMAVGFSTIGCRKFAVDAN